MTGQRLPDFPTDDQREHRFFASVADLSDDECRHVARHTLARAKEVHNRSALSPSGHEPLKTPSPPSFFVLDMDLTKMSDEEIHELAEQLNQQLGALVAEQPPTDGPS